MNLLKFIKTLSSGFILLVFSFSIQACNSKGGDTLNVILGESINKYLVVSYNGDSMTWFEKTNLAWHLRSLEEKAAVPKNMEISDNSDLVFAKNCISSILKISPENIKSTKVYKSSFGSDDEMQSLYFLTDDSSKDVYIYLFRN